MIIVCIPYEYKGRDYIAEGYSVCAGYSCKNMVQGSPCMRVQRLLHACNVSHSYLPRQENVAWPA